MKLKTALAVYAHFYHITPLKPKETARLRAARKVIRKRALKSVK